MPTYEYQCEKCDTKFEKLQNMSDAPLKECPKCGEKVKRLIGTGMGVVYKGGGFHATDYRTREASNNACQSGQTCCGRNVPCETRPCDQ